MRTLTRALAPVLAAVGLAATLNTSLSAPAHAMPERYADAGIIVFCDGDGGSLTATDTTKAGTTLAMAMLVGDVFASVGGELAVIDGTDLRGTFPAHDDDSGAELGDLTVEGTLSRGETEVLSGWDRDPHGTRTETEGTRTPLSGRVTLTLGETSMILTCVGWEFDTETFKLARGSASTVDTGWWANSYELDEGAGVIGFYGDQHHELGVALDLFGPSYVVGGERLQIRNGHVDGSVLLRDPETWAVLGIAKVVGTVTETGREQTVERSHGYQQVTDLVHYDVALTINTDRGEWSGTWSATHETGRTLSVLPPKAL